MVARVLMLPGAVLPAELAYGPLLAELGDGVEAVAKDLELYATPEPPAGYSLETEADGAVLEADRRGWGRFHLVGYSGGGASAIVCAARHPQRVASLALLEPAWGGSWDQSAKERSFWDAHAEIEKLPHDEFMAAFVRLALKPGVSSPPPPPGEPPPWMASRPAGIRAFARAFAADRTTREELARYPGPVYLALGGLSNEAQYGEIAKRLATAFGDFELEVFDERHHFDPPHRLEPARLAGSLRALWARADA